MCRALAISRKCARHTEQAVLWRSVHTACAETDSQSRTVTHFTGGKTETQSCRVAEPGTGPKEFGRGTTCALPQHLAGSSHRLREVGNTVPLCRSVCRGSGHPELCPRPPRRRLGSFWPFRHLCSQVRLGRWTLNRQYLGGLVIIATASVLQAKGREGLRVHRAG